MELKELEGLKNLNELDLLFKIIDLSESCRKDTERILKGNNTAGVRVRQKMQDLRFLAELIRERVQETKGVEKVVNKNKKGVLDKAIEKEKKRLKKDKEALKKKIEYLRIGGN